MPRINVWKGLSKAQRKERADKMIATRRANKLAEQRQAEYNNTVVAVTEDYLNDDAKKSHVFKGDPVKKEVLSIDSFPERSIMVRIGEDWLSKLTRDELILLVKLMGKF